MQDLPVDTHTTDMIFLGERVRGVALIATDVLKAGDELLLDYRLNPNVDRPPGYTPVDSTREYMRWS